MPGHSGNLRHTTMLLNWSFQIVEENVSSELNLSRQSGISWQYVSLNLSSLMHILFCVGGTLWGNVGNISKMNTMGFFVTTKTNWIFLMMQVSNESWFFVTWRHISRFMNCTFIPKILWRLRKGNILDGHRAMTIYYPKITLHSNSTIRWQIEMCTNPRHLSPLLGLDLTVFEN